MTGSREPSPYLVLAVAVLFVSVGSIFVRLAEAPPLAVAFYRIAFATLMIAPFALRSARATLPGLPRRSRWLVLLAGLALALHFAAWITSLSYTSIASSVLLVNTAPVFAVAFSRIFLDERVRGAVLFAIALALLGALLIAAGDWQRAPSSLTGNLLAIAGAITLAAYHVLGRGLRDALPMGAYVLCVWTAAAVVLAGIAAVSGTPFAPYPVRTWGMLLALALVPTVFGHGLVNRSLRALSAPTVGLFLLGEPLLASALAFVLLHEVPAPGTALGGIVVLLALGLVVLRPDA